MCGMRSPVLIVYRQAIGHGHGYCCFSFFISFPYSMWLVCFRFISFARSLSSKTKLDE